MKREEAVALLERYSNYDGIGIPNLAGCKEAMKVAVDALKEAFPELAESEDERIRKEMLKHFNDALVSHQEVTTSEQVKSWIAYLEKRKEQKPVKWNKEDEKIRKTLLDFFDSDAFDCGGESEWKNGIKYKEVLRWLQYNNKLMWKSIDNIPIFPCNILYKAPNGNMFIYRYLEGGKKNDAETVMFNDLIGGEWMYLSDLDFSIKQEWSEPKINGKPIPTENQSVNIPLAEWSEGDKVNIDTIISYLDAYINEHDNSFGADECRYLKHWLKSLSERFNLQPKPEWSEEDEKMLNEVLDMVTYAFYEQGNDGEIEDNPAFLWLHKLRPSWKPSEEDLMMLEHIIGQYETGNKNSKVMGYLPRVKELDFLKKVFEIWKN